MNALFILTQWLLVCLSPGASSRIPYSWHIARPSLLSPPQLLRRLSPLYACSPGRPAASGLLLSSALAAALSSLSPLLPRIYFCPADLPSTSAFTLGLRCVWGRLSVTHLAGQLALSLYAFGPFAGAFRCRGFPLVPADRTPGPALRPPGLSRSPRQSLPLSVPFWRVTSWEFSVRVAGLLLSFRFIRYLTPYRLLLACGI